MHEPVSCSVLACLTHPSHRAQHIQVSSRHYTNIVRCNGHDDGGVRTVEALDLVEALARQHDCCCCGAPTSGRCFGYIQAHIEESGPGRVSSHLSGRHYGVQNARDLESMSVVQVDKGILPAIADLDVPLVMESRLKKLIKAIQEAARVSWDYKREEAMRGENVPLPSDELMRLEILFFSINELRIPVDENTDESVGTRSKRQLSDTASGS